jgi:transposase
MADAPAGIRVRVGMTCWRRVRDWQQAGVWDLIHFALLDWLARDDQIDWSRAVVDSCSIRAVYGGDQTGPNPTDRAKRGSKRHLICDGRGVPLAVRLTGANRNDSQEALLLVDAIPPLQGGRGRPRRRPTCVLGDRGYDAAAIRSGLRARHIAPLLATRRTEHGSGLGRWRWVVERTFAWLNQFRRLRVRYDKRADIHEAFLLLGCALLAVAAKALDDGLIRFSLAITSFVAKISLDPWHYLSDRASAPTKSSRCSARAAWARSIALVTRS